MSDEQIQPTPKKRGVLIKTYNGKRNFGNIQYDNILIFFRDEQGTKHCTFYDRPKMSYYILKDRTSPEAIIPPMSISLSKVDRVEVYSDDLMHDVAERTGTLHFYDQCLINRDSYGMRNLLRSNLLYEADMNLEDQYISKFYDEYDSFQYDLRKGFFDIEVDLMSDGDETSFIGFPDPETIYRPHSHIVEKQGAPCPINIITFIDTSCGKFDVVSYVCRNPLNKSLKEFESKQAEFGVFIKKTLKENDDIDITSYTLKFFDKEHDLISKFFEDVHNVDPDYMGAWNDAFDLKTLKQRLININSDDKNMASEGKDPTVEASRTISDHKALYQTLPNGKTMMVKPFASFRADDRQQQGRKMSTFQVLDGINWIDQEELYEDVHMAAEGRLDSYSLDSVSYHELGKEKLEFAPGETIKNLSWKNFWKFAEYNVYDVVRLTQIEKKVKDLDLLQAQAELMKTRVTKTFSRSVSLINYISDFARKNGEVLSTNKNVRCGTGTQSEIYDRQYRNVGKVKEFDQKYVDAFSARERNGGLVANPNLNNPNGAEIVKNSYSKYIYNNIIDLDLSSLYPSCITAFNIDNTSLIGRFFLIDPEIKKTISEKFKNPAVYLITGNDDDDSLDATTNDSASALADSIVSRDWTRIGREYMNLPSVEDAVTAIRASKTAKSKQ